MEAGGVAMLLEHVNSAFEKDMDDLQMLKADIAWGVIIGVIDPKALEPMLEVMQDKRRNTLLCGKEFLEMNITSSSRRNLFYWFLL